MAGSGFYAALAVTGLLVCGSLNTVTMKIAFTMTGENLQGEEVAFAKPWFVTFIMFVGMAVALLFDRSMWARSKGEYKALPDGGEVPEVAWSYKVKMVAIPAVFDILATGLCSMGFMYIPASVWQLLRGAEMIFAAIFAVVFLRQKLYAFHWLGVALCTGGIVSVGLASVWGASSDEGAGGNAGADTLLLGMGLSLLGQVVQAAQVIAEEWLLKEVDLPGIQIVGFEGVWGGLIMVLACFPALYFLPGADNGHMEDVFDAAHMIASSQPLALMIFVYILSCATYNMSGIAVTEALTAVHRVMLEAFRTSIVWVFGLTVHYYVDSKSAFGEAWTPYSWLEVCGFLLLMVGQAVYGEMLRIPGLEYPMEQATSVMPTPGTLKHLASPLPRTVC